VTPEFDGTVIVNAPSVRLRWQCRDQCSPRLRAYATAADTRASDFAGASAINATPMTTSTAEPTRNPTRWLAVSSPSIEYPSLTASVANASDFVHQTSSQVPPLTSICADFAPGETYGKVLTLSPVDKIVDR
jgi:hypothetical protein